MAKLATKLAKRGVELAVGLELRGLGQRMLEMNRQMEEEKKQQEQPKAEEAPIVEEYQYVFYEKAVKEVFEVVSNLIEVVLSKGVEVDHETMSRAKKLIDMMAWVLEDKKEEYGN